MFFDPAYQSLKNGLVGYWSPVATGPTGLQLLDLSGQNNHGTLTNTEPASDWQQSNLPQVGAGTVIDYDSTLGSEDYADCGNKIILDNTGYSFAGWFNFNGTTNNWQTIISKHSGTNRQIWCGRNNNFGPPTNGFSFFSNNSGNGSIGSSSLTYNRWYFFALTHIGNTTTSNNLWVWSQEEGFLQTTRFGTTGGCDADAGTTTIKIGRMDSGANIYPANAKIADIMCWKRVLSEGEVLSLLNLGPGKLIRSKPNVAIAKRKWWPGAKAPKSRPIIPTQRGIKSGPIFYDPKASWFRNGLVGHWCPNLTGPTGTQLLDLSGQNNNGTLTNMDAPTDWVQSDKGLTLDFDGVDDQVALSNPVSLQNLTSFSVVAWVNCTYAKDWNGIYSGGSQDGTGWQFAVRNNRRLFMGDRFTYEYNTAGNSTPLGWFLAGVTYQSGIGTFYINGTNAGTFTQSNLQSNSSSKFIGKFNTNRDLAGFFGGQIANLSVYNRALNPSEVQQLYQRGSGGFASSKPYRNKLSYSPAPKKIFKSRIDRKRSVSFVHPDHDNEWVTNGLVGFWCPSLTGATGTQLLDLSGQNNNGTLTNMDAPTDWVDSPYGTVLDFDGTNDYVTTSSKDYDYITLSGWVKVNAGATAFLINKNYNGANVPFSLSAYASAGIVSGFAFFDGLWRSTGIGTSDIRGDGLWHHIAGTFDGTNLLYYVDGKVAASNTVTAGVLPKNNNPIDIGVYRNDSNHFGGQIASACIHNRALTPSEIQQLYQLGPRMGFSRRPSRSPTWMVEADETIGNRRRRIICGGKN